MFFGKMSLLITGKGQQKVNSVLLTGCYFVSLPVWRLSVILEVGVITMMRKMTQLPGGIIAVFSDIHSNYHALKACFEDAKGAGATGFVFLGDYVSGLADPVKTLDLVYEICDRYPSVCIQGNRERYMLNHKNGSSVLTKALHTASYLFTYENLREKDLAFFASLPIFDVITVGGVSVEIAHATKFEDRRYFEKGDGYIGTVFGQMEAAYLLTGHSHKQYIQSEQGKTIMNPGAVGLPLGADGRAQYALLDVSSEGVDCRMRQVRYDFAPMIRAQFQSGLVDEAKYWAISDLYAAITGKEYTKLLLDHVYRCAEERKDALCDEQVWRSSALKLGLHFTEEEILHFLEKES